MTDETTPREEPEASPKTERSPSDWIKDAEEALNGVGEALRNAWDASRDSRMNALASAKKASTELGDAIERGVAAMRENRDRDDSPDSTAEEE